MNPYSGRTYELLGREGDAPMPGATVEAKAAIASGMIDVDGLDDEHREDLEELVAKGGRLVAVEAEAVQRLRLGDRELRRRRQRR